MTFKTKTEKFNYVKFIKNFIVTTAYVGGVQKLSKN